MIGIIWQLSAIAATAARQRHRTVEAGTAGGKYIRSMALSSLASEKRPLSPPGRALLKRDARGDAGWPDQENADARNTTEATA